MAAIKGLEKFAPGDYPGFVSATVFVGGCNFRCPFCHNRQLALQPERLEDFPVDCFHEFLDARKGWLEAVCVSGGEPLIHGDIAFLLRSIKDRALKVKIDTNGSFPRHLDDLMRTGLIDCVALDIKAPPDRYEEATGMETDFDDVLKSLSLIRESAPDYMFRTTAVPGLVDAEGIAEIGRLVRGAGRFQLQQFRPAGTLDASYESIEPYPAAVLREFVEILKRDVADVRLVGV